MPVTYTLEYTRDTCKLHEHECSVISLPYFLIHVRELNLTSSMKKTSFLVSGSFHKPTLYLYMPVNTHVTRELHEKECSVVGLPYLHFSIHISVGELIQIATRILTGPKIAHHSNGKSKIVNWDYT